MAETTKQGQVLINAIRLLSTRTQETGKLDQVLAEKIAKLASAYLPRTAEELCNGDMCKDGQVALVREYIEITIALLAMVYDNAPVFVDLVKDDLPMFYAASVEKWEEKGGLEGLL